MQGVRLGLNLLQRERVGCGAGGIVAGFCAGSVDPVDEALRLRSSSHMAIIHSRTARRNPVRLLIFAGWGYCYALWITPSPTSRSALP